MIPRFIKNEIVNQRGSPLLTLNISNGCVEHHKEVSLNLTRMRHQGYLLLKMRIKD